MYRAMHYVNQPLKINLIIVLPYRFYKEFLLSQTFCGERGLPCSNGWEIIPLSPCWGI